MPLPPPVYTIPSGSPVLSIGDTFNPTYSAGPDIGAPSLGAVLPQDQPGDTLTLAGSFSTSATFETYSQTTGGNALQVAASVRRLVANRAVLTLSDSIPTNSMILLYGIAAGAYSTPAVLNRADAWWSASHTTGKDSVCVGDTVSVFGRSLSGDTAYPYDTSSPSTKCLIWLYTASHAGQYVTCASINPYRAQFTMPALWPTATSVTSLTYAAGSKSITTQAGLGYFAGLALTLSGSGGFMQGTVTSYSGTALVVNVTTVENGSGGSGASWTIEPTYDVSVYLHNTHGGDYGWSRAITLHLSNRPTLEINYDKIAAINIAAPNGVDDITEINNKIASAGSDGPVSLVLQAGTYRVSSRITLVGGWAKSFQLKGQGAGVTTIIPTAGFTPTNGEIVGSSSAISELRDLTIDYNSSATETSIFIPRIVNCTISIRSPSAIEHTSFLFMTGCNITAPYTKGEDISSAYVDSNTFYGTDLADQLFVVWGGRNICFTNNTGQHLNPSGTNAEKTHGRFYVGSVTNQGTQRNVYISGNTTPGRLDNPTFGFGDGEVFLWDSAYCSSSSMATAATSTSVTITDAAFTSWITRRDAAITGGLGVGQMRQITNVVGNVLTIDPPWDLIPDTTSRVNVVGTTKRVVIYNNQVTGGNVLSDGSEQGDSQGFQIFSGGDEIIADGNTFTDMNFGYSLWAISATVALTLGVSPLFFTLVCNNTFVHCNSGIRTVVDVTLAGETAVNLGNVHRNNTFTNTVTRGWTILWVMNNSDLEVMQDSTLTGEYYGIHSEIVQVTNIVVVDSSFVGSGLPGGQAKYQVTVNDVGTTSYINFETLSEGSTSGVGAMNINITVNIQVTGY